jgi:hypothetical protein
MSTISIIAGHTRLTRRRKTSDSERTSSRPGLGQRVVLTGGDLCRELIPVPRDYLAANRKYKAVKLQGVSGADCAIISVYPSGSLT